MENYPKNRIENCPNKRIGIYPSHMAMATNKHITMLPHTIPKKATSFDPLCIGIAKRRDNRTKNYTKEDPS